MRKSYRGKYTPKHPTKYMGDAKNIIYRSMLERRVMVYLDTNPSILAWGSEELIIEYISPLDNAKHRYFPDFLVKLKNKQDQIKTVLVEVKPFSQTLPPQPRKRKSKWFTEECNTYLVNSAKWNAAKAFCSQHDWTFMILTERMINRQGK